MISKYTTQHAEPLVGNYWSLEVDDPANPAKGVIGHVFSYQNKHGRQPAAFTVYKQHKNNNTATGSSD